MSNPSPSTKIRWTKTLSEQQEQRNRDRKKAARAQKTRDRVLERRSAAPARKPKPKRRKPARPVIVKRPQHAPGIVYILRHNGRCKIGMTTNVPQRVEQLKREWRMQHYRIEHLIQAADRLALERELHAMFAHRRAFSEWFDLTTDDLLEIKAQWPA
jgi:hypothetical protein